MPKRLGIKRVWSLTEMAIVFIFSLVALLESKENEVGYVLTQSEVEPIRDNATTVELPS